MTYDIASHCFDDRWLGRVLGPPAHGEATSLQAPSTPDLIDGRGVTARPGYGGQGRLAPSKLARVSRERRRPGGFMVSGGVEPRRAPARTPPAGRSLRQTRSGRWPRLLRAAGTASVTLPASRRAFADRKSTRACPADEAGSWLRVSACASANRRHASADRPSPCLARATLLSAKASSIRRPDASTIFHSGREDRLSVLVLAHFHPDVGQQRA